MSPEKIAIAVAVTIAAIAGIGAMKKVTGTSSAVAIVAVSPGTAPTNRPNSDASQHHHEDVGLEAPARSACARRRPSACYQAKRLQHAPGQRHAQQLVEREVDRRASPTSATATREPAAARASADISAEQHERRGEQEAEPVAASRM